MRPSGTRPALLTLLITLTAARAAPVVSLQTAPSPALPGSSFNLTISVEEVVDLYAFQFELSYAPTLLAASAINEGPFLAQGGTTIFLPGAIENDQGRIGSTVDTLVGVVPGVSGNGVLATVLFQMLAADTGPVTLSNVILLNSRLQPIPATTAGTTIDRKSTRLNSIHANISYAVFC